MRYLAITIGIVAAITILASWPTFTRGQEHEPPPEPESVGCNVTIGGPGSLTVGKSGKFTLYGTSGASGWSANARASNAA